MSDRLDRESAVVEWQPGDRLITGRDCHHRPIFSLHDESMMEDDCRCPDAASWPVDHRRPLAEGDELGEFIAEVRASEGRVS